MKPIHYSTPDEILDNFGPVERAKAPEFFYTRLKARMEKEFIPARPASWVLRPVFALSALVLIICINVFVLLKNESRQTETPVASTTVAETESMQSLVSEFSLNDNTAMVDINNDSK